MTYSDFKSSLTDSNPPEGLSRYLLSLWYDGHGDWDRSHSIAQDIEDDQGAWIHAYLHRKEGDEWNAGYWYRRAGRSYYVGSLDDEWDDLVKWFCAKM